ncbi:MAG: helix-turn-helix transcriptional regulator [Candidatus Aenigmatarchaeota archaeon]
MKRLIALVALIWIFSVPGAVAAESHDITFEVKDGSVEVGEELVLGNDTEELRFFVPGDTYNIRTRIDGDPTTFDLVDEDNKRIMVLDIEESAETASLEYESSEPVDEGSPSYFVYGFRTDRRTENVDIKLVLPEGAVLSGSLDSTTPPVNPQPEEVTTTGKRLVIRWHEEDFEPEDTFSMFVSYEEDSFNWLYLLPLLALGVIAALFFYYRKKRVEEVLDSFSHLLDKEKKIVEELAKADENTLWQKQLQHRTGFTKSKLSRTVRNLEERNVLEKIPHGTSNKVRLILEGGSDEKED